MKKLIYILIIALLLVFVVGYYKLATTKRETTIDPTEKVEEVKEEFSQEEYYKMIDFKSELLKTKDKTMLTLHKITNNSDKHFTGKVDINFLQDGKTADTITLEIDVPSNDFKDFKVESRIVNPLKVNYQIWGDFGEYKGHVSEYYHKEIFQFGTYIRTLFIEVESIEEEVLMDIAKEYVDKYNGEISTIKFFIKNENIIIGENPYNKDVDENAEYVYSTNEIVY